MSPQNPAYCLQNRTDHPAQLFRNALSGLVPGAMVQGATSVGGGVSPYVGNRLVVTGTAGMTVNVDTGLVYIPGSSAFQGLYAGYNTPGGYSVTVPASNSSQWRSDYIAVVLNDTAFGGASDTWDIVDVAGAFSSSSPGALPSLPNNAVPLAIIRVVPNMTVTNGAGTVVDARIYGNLGGPIVTTSSNRPPLTAPNGVMWYETDTNLLGVLVNGAYQYIVNTSGLTAITDTAHTFGTLSNSWAIGSGGQAKYRLNALGELQISMINLSPGTKTDGTQIWTAANGLPAGWAPVTSRRVTAMANAEAAETCGLSFNSDGSITVFGISGTSATRFDCCATFPRDF